MFGFGITHHHGPPHHTNVQKHTSLIVLILTLATNTHLFTNVSSSSIPLPHGARPSTTTTLRPSSGLINLANTCYLNSQLESIYHIPLLRDIIISSSNIDNNDQQRKRPTLALSALAQIFETMLQSSSTPSSPQVLCQAVGIDVYEQQDSQEFWKLLLPELECDDVMDLYRGSFEDYILAVDGSGEEKIREEPFLDLSLDLSSGSVLSSLDSMFNTPELLTVKDGNGWKPYPKKDPHKVVDALKGSLMRVHALPSILQLHLKRFRYDWETDVTSKVNDRFMFPKVLDLTKICTDIQDDELQLAKYDLQSIIVHSGDYGSGHYYTYARPNIRSGQWYRFDDDRVTKVSYDEVELDSFGGKRIKRRNKHDEEENTTKRGGGLGGFLDMIFGSFDSNEGEYGWGGRNSCAYVLQYVRRSDIPHLFEEE